LEDWARKTSLEILGLALRLQYAVAREDLTGLINTMRRIENKDHRARLIIMGYRRMGKWIDWQAMKRGAPLAIVDPRGHPQSARNAVRRRLKMDIEDLDAYNATSKQIETLLES
jgi:IS605 OrfB family transposase